MTDSQIPLNRLGLPETVWWKDGELYFLDQTQLPLAVVGERQDTLEQVIASIQAAMNYHPPVANELPNAIDLINRALQYRGQDLKVPEIAAKMKIHPRTVRDYLEIAQADKRILKALAAEKITHYQALELKRGKKLPEQFPKGKVPSVRELRELRRARAEAASKELAR